MNIKKNYKVSDTVWISGISRTNINLTKGTVISTVDLTDAGYSPSIIHYVISIPTEIEPLLEIRTWETISQDKQGPVGSLRELGNVSAENKKMSHIGYVYSLDSHYDSNLTQLPNPLEKVKDSVLPKRKYYSRKKKV